MKPNTLDPFMITDAREACRIAASQQAGAETAITEATDDLAAKEQAYRVALALEIVAQHAAGRAWTVCPDLARGDAKVAQLRYERDVAKGVLDAAHQSAYRHGANRKDLGRFVDWSARIDLASGGQENVPPTDSPAYGTQRVAA